MSEHAGHGGHMEHGMHMTTPGDSMDDMAGMGGMGGMDMHMSFYAGNKVTILFSGWTTTTTGQLIGACVGVFIMALLFEALRAFREHLYTRSRGDSNTSLLSDGSRRWASAVVAPAHLIQTALYGIQITLGYLLMLLIMTYNVFICLAIVFGATVGFLVFGWRKCLMFDITADHCG